MHQCKQINLIWVCAFSCYNWPDKLSNSDAWLHADILFCWAFFKCYFSYFSNNPYFVIICRNLLVKRAIDNVALTFSPTPLYIYDINREKCEYGLCSLIFSFSDPSSQFFYEIEKNKHFFFCWKLIKKIWGKIREKIC